MIVAICAAAAATTPIASPFFVTPVETSQTKTLRNTHVWKHFHFHIGGFSDGV
jgi:hypothetical protein